MNAWKSIVQWRLHNLIIRYLWRLISDCTEYFAIYLTSKTFTVILVISINSTKIELKFQGLLDYFVFTRMDSIPMLIRLVLEIQSHINKISKIHILL